jgi:iron complex transport system permease protein
VAVVIGVAAVLGAALVGSVVGAAGIDPISVLKALIDRLPGVSLDSGLTATESVILFDIRLPRIVLGALVGAVLAVSGAAYQGVFRNPLADPYLLGVAAGAGLGATLGFALTGRSGWIAPLAFAGGLGAVAIT